MKKIQTPELLRRAEVRPQSLDKKNRTVEVVFSTGARVMRRPFFDEPYWEELSLDPAHVRLDRLNNGAPFLRVHDDWTLESVLGVVESAATDGSVGTAVIRFSERPDVEPVFNDITSGILRHVSVGYKVWHYDEMPKAEDGIRVLRATDWEPVELSAVPVGADDGAVVRSGGSVNECVINFMEEIMTKKKRQDEAPEQKPVVAEEAGDEEKKVEDPAEVEAGDEEEKVEDEKKDEEGSEAASEEKVEDAERKGALAERERINGIRNAVRAANLAESFADDFIKHGTPLDEARAKVIDILADRDRQSDTRTARMEVIDMEEKKTRRDAVAAAIMHRADTNRELPEAAREYRGMNLMDMAREAVEKAGGRTRGLSRREIAVAALNLDRNVARMHGVSDFPEILSTAVNRTLRDAYQLAPRTFVPWCRKSTAPDFREVARTQLSELSKFQSVNPGGEYKHLSFGDSAEKYSLAKSGGIVAVTWEAIINDDLDAFSRIPFALAEEAAASESDIVYGILSGNPNMADTVALFDASTHKNYTTSSGTAISDTSLGVARALMRKQKGPKGRELNITPDFLIVGPDREVLANKYTSASFVAAKASDITPNFFSALQVIVEPRITGNAWYLAAKPMRIDTIEYAYLEGEEGLFTEERVGFEVDGIEIKARHVFAAKAIDYRGLYKNDGA
ncbi:MAG TPA: hypothetical protein PLY45_00045 [bacterium]|nr:hypothetical protein [bacterium]